MTPDPHNTFVEKKLEEFDRDFAEEGKYLYQSPDGENYQTASFSVRDFLRTALTEAFERGVNSEDIATLAYDNGRKSVFSTLHTLEEKIRGMRRKSKLHNGADYEIVYAHNAAIDSVLQEIRKLV